MLLHWLVGIAIENSAYQMGIASNPDVQPTKAQIERFLAEIDSLPPRQTLNEVIGKSERLYGLAAFQDMYWGISSADNSSSFLSPNLTWTLDLNIAMSRLNETYDALLSSDEALALDDDIFTPKPTFFNPLPLLFTSSRTHKITDILLGLSGRAIQASRGTEQRLICSANIQRLTLALLLYKNEHGTLPDGDWRESIKPYLGENPKRYFRCPMCQLAEDETAYALVVGEPSSVASPTPFLIVEVAKPQKLGKGDGRVALKTLEELSKIHSDFQMGNRSGAVRFLPKDAKPEELKELLEGKK